MKKNHWLLGVIPILALILRLYRLGEVPPGIANDEINIIINAQSLLKTGQNIPGVVTGIFGSGKIPVKIYPPQAKWRGNKPFCVT